jgi:hypothetical protein
VGRRRFLRRHSQIPIACPKKTAPAIPSVENTGPPVPVYEVPSLFEPFRRLPRNERLARATATSNSPFGLTILPTATAGRPGRPHSP